MLERQYLFAESIGGIEMDATIDETHTSTLVITTHPVEAGAPLLDHTYMQPAIVTLNVAHGLTPLYMRDQQGNSIRLTKFFDDLKTAQANAERLELVTALETYDDMLIENIVAVRNKQNTSTVSVTVLLRQVLFVNPESIVDFDNRFSDAVQINRRAQQKTNRGNTSAQELAPGSAEDKQAKTAAAAVFDAGRAALGF